ncbi:MAG: hypothetical protein ACREJM_01090, partial [Candidatus Saccharimonadales bacterium]
VANFTITVAGAKVKERFIIVATFVVDRAKREMDVLPRLGREAPVGDQSLHNRDVLVRCIAVVAGVDEQRVRVGVIGLKSNGLEASGDHVIPARTITMQHGEVPVRESRSTPGTSARQCRCGVVDGCLVVALCALDASQDQMGQRARRIGC